MDRPCLDILRRLKLPDVYTIALEELEADNKELLDVKKARSRIEYYFTCTPSLPLYILNNWPEVDTITYLDADLFFFADPAPIYREFSGHSIAIIPHRFPPNLRSHERHGIYNVGYLSFKRDPHASTCLQWWKNKCLEWCCDRVENNRYADQKYLDDWPTRFRGVVEIQHKGANLAPWNISNYTISNDKNGVRVDDQPLIFFHFHGFRQINRWLYDPNLAIFKVKPSQTVKQSVVAPYIHALVEVTELVSPELSKPSIPYGIRRQSKNSSLQYRLWKALDSLICLSRTILTKNYIVVINDRIM
ncbi:MAG: hypothetical protein H8D96_13475 [Desulfobacterales bacterium]|uniref:Glycosyl transferase n=1 Tax=Candidatus Desulfatibia vada TaxID=2841696 RepID=A0A8J6P5Y5_9BACT|nr:hypothetical protein [Candidatus Desulfatibia vada]